MKTLLKNCRLIPDVTEGYDGTLGDVVIDDRTIEKIYPVGTAQKADRVIDIAGNTLLPGFMDLHTHLYFKHEDIPLLASQSNTRATIDGVSFAQDKLRYGYTTLRDCGCPFFIAAEIRDGIRRGDIAGPRIIASGHCVSPATRGNATFGALYREFDDPAEARKVVREQLANGADFIKYMATGAVLNPGGEAGALITSKEELSALVRAADENGTYVAAHCHGISGIKLCIECGVRTIEHASLVDQDCIDMIKKSDREISLIPTLAIVYALKNGIVANIPEEVMKKVSDMYENVIANLERAHRAGILIGWGTDIDQDSFDRAPMLEFIARKE